MENDLLSGNIFDLDRKVVQIFIQIARRARVVVVLSIVSVIVQWFGLFMIASPDWSGWGSMLVVTIVESVGFLAVALVLLIFSIKTSSWLKSFDEKAIDESIHGLLLYFKMFILVSLGVGVALAMLDILSRLGSYN